MDLIAKKLALVVVWDLGSLNLWHIVEDLEKIVKKSNFNVIMDKSVKQCNVTLHLAYIAIL